MRLFTNAFNVLRREGFGQFMKRSASYCRRSLNCGRDSDETAVVVNRRLAEQEYHHRVEKMRAAPRDVTIQTTTRCNLRCVMCWHGFYDGLEPRDIASDHVHALAHFMKSAESVQLCGDGEPLMSPAFWQALEFVSGQHGQGLPTASIFSNGTLINQRNAERLIKGELRAINVSLDAGTAETYRKIRGAELSSVLGSIDRLLSARRRLGSPWPEVLINMTLMMENISELSTFMEIGKELGVDKVCFRHMIGDAGHRSHNWVINRKGWLFNYDEQLTSRHPEFANRIIREAVKTASRLGLEISTGAYEQILLPENCEVGAQGDQSTLATLGDCGQGEAGDDMAGSRNSASKQCEAPWRWFFVGIDGRVRACCYMTGAVGDLREESPSEIWNGSRMWSLRKAISNHRLHDLCRGAFCAYARNLMCST